MQKLKVNDTVQVLAGKDKGKQGKIKTINFKTNRVLVEGVNIVKKATKPNQANQQGGIVDMEKAVHISNVSLLDPKSGKPTRVSITKVDGKNTRVATKSKSEFK
ncbi:MAG TPA: 50S ribosomal protein L24 [Bacteriovoracaceae bacterium]|nr:50S ribosomal protein L24 [Bacteriovoracaceae bacterium]